MDKLAWNIWELKEPCIMSFLFFHVVGRVISFASKEVSLILRFDALKAVRTSVVRAQESVWHLFHEMINVSSVIGSLCVPSFGFCYIVV